MDGQSNQPSCDTEEARRCPQDCQAKTPDADSLCQIPVGKGKAADSRQADNNQCRRRDKARLYRRRTNHNAPHCGHGLAHCLGQVDSAFLEQLKGNQKAQHLPPRGKGDIPFALNHRPEERKRNHLLMENGQGYIESRKEQARQQGSKAENTDAGGGKIVPAQILGAVHQAAQIHRGQIAQGQAVHQKAHPPIQKPQAEGVGPLGILEQREGRCPGAGNRFLHRTGGKEVVYINGMQTAFHSLHQIRSGDAVQPGNRHIGQAFAPHLRLVQAQGRCT